MDLRRSTKEPERSPGAKNPYVWLSEMALQNAIPRQRGVGVNEINMPSLSFKPWKE